MVNEIAFDEILDGDVLDVTQRLTCKGYNEHTGMVEFEDCSGARYEIFEEFGDYTYVLIERKARIPAKEAG